jgi:hypothetical protein
MTPLALVSRTSLKAYLREVKAALDAYNLSWNGLMIGGRGRVAAAASLHLVAGL